MLALVNVLFRLRVLYGLLGFPRALYVKYYLMMAGNVLQWICGAALLCLTRKIYLPLVLGSIYLIQSYDSTNGGLITLIHDAGLFGTWRQASHVATYGVYALIGVHFLAPAIPF